MVPRLPIRITWETRGLRWALVVVSILLFALNAWVCRELFAIGFIRNLDSNEGAFVSLARFYRDHWTNLRWFPWFNAGMPIENAYQPLLPVVAALTQALSGWPIERAFHFVLAFAYCLGPVALFWFAFDWSESLALSLSAAIASSLLSPAEWLVPILRQRLNGHWGPLRLFNLVHYAEDPHIVALSLLPVALLFLRRAMMTPVWRNMIPAVVFSASVVITNAFGAVDLALGGLCIFLAVRKGLAAFAAAGVAAYLWISPWLPPSLIRLMGHDQWSARGDFVGGLQTCLMAATGVAAFAGLWLATRRLRVPIERFAILFAVCMCAIPIGYFAFGITLVPQASRYQLELELGVCLVIGCLCARVPRRFGMAGGVVLAIVVLAAGIRQAKIFRHFARNLIQPIDIAQTIQYKTVMWLDRNLPRGDRVMVSGDTEFLYNLFSDNPQMIGGHQPTSPNWMQKVALYVIYVGGGGAREAEISLLWLKAFGNQAITVPGATSREFYHPVVHPHRFDGILPVLWHNEDDTIFAVPQRSRSLAHVIPRQALVAREPIHGLDVDPLKPYVAALDDPSLPVADMRWSDLSHASVRALIKRGQVLSIQMNYAPGWRASMNGRAIPVIADKIGLITVDPGCDGQCEVHLEFGVTPEAWLCRIMSAAITIGLAGFGIARTRAAEDRCDRTLTKDASKPC